MKKYFLLALVVLTGIASSCKYDDDEVWDSVNNLADRVTNLETLTKQMNSDIVAMQGIVNAMQKGLTVTEVEELADGYILHFSDGTKATIKNGADGKDGANGSDGKDGADGENGKDGKDGKDAPVVGVAQDNGVYYWTMTIDGKTEWLTDEDGNKMPVSGADGEDGKDGSSSTGSTGAAGKDGKTPVVTIKDGYWYINDVNTNVQAVGKNGQDGDSMFQSIAKDGDVLKITLTTGNKVYELPLAAAVTYSGEGYSNGVVSMIKEEVVLTYTVSQMSNPSVEVIKAEGVSVTVDESKNTLNIQFLPGTTKGKAVILYYNSNQTITSVLTVTTGVTTGIPSDSQAGATPEVKDEDKNFEMPTSISAMSVDPNNPYVGRFNLAGIQIPNQGWLELYGTGDENQNVWLEINGQPKGIKVINGEEVVARSRASIFEKAKADVVFLVDNSGSMSEEADKVAEEILEWSNKLSQTMDVNFGCVGNAEAGTICGALNITDVKTLHSYLKANNKTGTSRTKHFGENMENKPTDCETLKAKASSYGSASDECGGIMLRFADENFTFRPGANRFYVYFTDEPNQPGGKGKGQWSVLSVNPKVNEEHPNLGVTYNWGANRGVIYTVFSSTMNHETWNSWLNDEDPCLFSTYTGGQIIVTDAKFNISLDELPVTGAITKSFLFTFNITPDLKSGETYDVTIIIKTKDGNISKFTYKDVQFV